MVEPSVRFYTAFECLQDSKKVFISHSQNKVGEEVKRMGSAFFFLDSLISLSYNEVGFSKSKFLKLREKHRKCSNISLESLELHQLYE